MEKLDLKQHLLNAINESKDTDDWASLIKVGQALKLKGINYKDFGYEKLINLIMEHKDCLIWKVDKTNPKYPAFFVQEKSLAGKRRYQEMDKSLSGATRIKPAEALTTWASLGNYLETVEMLKRMALPEVWHYNNSTEGNPYPILAGYLKYTFYKLQQEGDKVVEKDNYAAFNTGLVDKRYEPIFALFSKTPNARRKWQFEAFCIAAEDKSGKELVRNLILCPLGHIMQIKYQICFMIALPQNRRWTYST